MCGRGGEPQQQASSTRHAGQPPPQLRPWELGNPWVDRDRVCGMVEQARTREQTALGWLFWGRQVEGGRLGAGSREQGAWARAGLVHRRGGVVAGPGLELELDFGPVGTIPTMGRFRWSQRPPALYVCVCNWSQSRYRQRLPIPIATDSPWRLATLTMSRLRRRRQRQQQQRGDGEGAASSSPLVEAYAVMSAFQRRPGSGVMPMLVGGSVLGGARGGGREIR